MRCSALFCSLTGYRKQQRGFPADCLLDIMKGFATVLSVVLLIHCSYAVPSMPSYLSENDSVRLKQVLSSAWDLKDLPSVHYSILGYKLLAEAVPKPQDVCKALLSWSNQGSGPAEVLFHVAGAWQALGSCGSTGNLPTSSIIKKLNEVASNDASVVVDLYHAVLGLKALGQRPSDVKKIVKNLQAALKKDDSAINLGHTFHIAAALGTEGSVFFDRIEDAVAQADEVNSVFLQFEGGLSITALVVSGAYHLAATQNKPPPVTHEQATKFANYFLSRRSVQTAKGVFSLIDVLNILASNKFHLPLCIALDGSNAVSAENPKVTVKICDVLGKPVCFSPMSVIAESATRIDDEVVVLSKKKFESTKDKCDGLYTLNVMGDKLSPGQYKIAISAALSKPDTRIPSNVITYVTIKAMSPVEINSFEIGTADADHTTPPKMNKVVYPHKLPSVLEADSQQKVVVRFQLTNPTTKLPLNVHQAFLRLWNEETNQEIIFNSDRDSVKNYKFELDIGAKDPDFGYLSGQFHVDLIIGDAIISNPLMWHVADLKLSAPSSETKSRTPPSHRDIFKPKPEITHMFREPEKRPSTVVSNLFTALVLFPLLILFVLWAKLGVNISNFPFSLSAIGFHLGLASIFGLFGIFWLQLSMFTTVKYLLALGLVTFLSGNKMLALIASRRKSQ